MAASHDHSMFPVHVHLNLLGWVSLTLFGLFYRSFPQAAQTTLAKVHFWIYVPSHFCQMVLLAMLFRGYTVIESVLGLVSSMVAAAISSFAVIVWKTTQLEN
jgi:cbb3-type cytochrome oxidase subunit 1